jgi:protein-disulfide isomerase
MKKVSWVVALLVGVVAGVALDRMVGGGAAPSRPAQHAVAKAPQAPPKEDPRAVYRVPVDDTPLRGSPDALVTIVVASDFQCPFCKRVEPTLAEVLKAFPGKVREGWRNFPLPFHAKAEPAAIVAEEARAQGGDAKFWEVHDKLFAASPALDRPDLERIAREAGLDVAKVQAALDHAKHRDAIRRDMDLCRSLGVNATPTLFVNGRKVAGALPFDQLKPIVEEELRKAEALVKAGAAPRDVYAKLQEKAARSVVYLPGSEQQRPTPPKAPPAPAASAARVPIRPDDPARGPASAKVTIALFSDFQCPFCARVEPTLRKLEEAFPGQLRIVWKHRPLPFHQHARPAAEAAEAAREQGKFWEMHDRLFANHSSLSPSLFESAARDLGLDLPRFKKALAAHAGARRIDEDGALAASVGASGTPTLFIDCRRVAGAYPFETFKPIVEEELRKAGALAREGKSGPALYDALCDENVKRYGGPAAAAASPQPQVLPGGPAAVPLRPDDPVKGRAGAPVTVVLFSDFQCPFCARAEPVVKAIEDAYPSQVRVAWKHLPLPMHRNAVPAALAAEAARAQGGSAKFWAMHDKLFANQGSLSADAFERYARELGLDVARFRADLASPKLRARVDEDSKLAAKLGVSATPTFVVNGERVVGSGGLRAVVERQLAQAKAR